MSILLSKLYRSVVSQYSIKLVAGHNGLSNVVKWIHMVENKEISSFLDGQEIVFTTGIGASTPEALLSLMEENIKNHASGMVVNIGPYIKEVTQEMIDYCNEMNFPLFVVPWQVKMARIIKVFCAYILEAEKNEIVLASALRNAIYSPEQTRLYVPILEEHGFQKNSRLRIAIISIEEMNIPKEILKDIKKKIEFMLDQLSRKAIVSEIDTSFVLLFSDVDKVRINNFSEQLIEFIDKKFTTLSFQITIGDEVGRLNDLEKSYFQAFRILRINGNEVIRNRIKNFSDIGAYKVLLELDYNDVIENYIVETIEPLSEYDKLKGTDYVDVLSLYLQNNGKVNIVASMLFVHRNTINYKLKRIEEILKCDLSDYPTRVNLTIAFMLQKVFNEFSLRLL